MRGKYVVIDKQILLDTYEKCGRSLNKTGEILGIPPKTIKRKFVEYGLEYDKKKEYYCNEDFFDELNEQSLYWLGFLATDGNVYKSKSSYTIRLKLATKDINILHKFKDHIGFTGPINSYIIKKNDNPSFKKEKYFASQVSLTSKKIFERLANFNIIPNKTHTLTITEELKNHPLVHHFIRGCIDGDGWSREHRNNDSEITTEIRIGMCGTELFVKDVFNIIKEKNKINSGVLFNRKNQCTWNFEFSGLHDVKNIVDWLYKDATIYLERKYNILKQAKDYAEHYMPINISKDQLQLEYQKYGSIIETSKQLNIDPRSVKTRLVNFDIEHNTKFQTKYNYNFFIDDTEMKYYWAGFIAGKSTYIKDKNYLAFNCNDKNVIELFLKQSKMRLSIIELKKDKSINYQINIFDPIILEQLGVFNINKDKQDNYIIPEWLLSDCNMHHFLRGYLDARSSLLFYNKLSLNIKNNKLFLNQLNDIFVKNGINTTAKIKETKNGSYQIIYLSNQAKAITDYLYKDATVYIQRKYDIAKQ